MLCMISSYHSYVIIFVDMLCVFINELASLFMHFQNENEFQCHMTESSIIVSYVVAYRVKGGIGQNTSQYVTTQSKRRHLARGVSQICYR